MTFWETFWAVTTATIIGQFIIWWYKRYLEHRLNKIADNHIDPAADKLREKLRKDLKELRE